MARPTTAISELTPAGGDQINAGDNRIREYKVQNREILEYDHVYPSSGTSATAGFHKQISLVEAADIGSGAEGLPILGAQTISDKPELVYTDEDDNDIQITKAGVLKPSTSTVLADWSAIMNLVYPVGSVVTLGVSTNPATLYGIGTWTAIAGRVIVGIDGTTEFATLDQTGGEKTHTLTTAEVPSLPVTFPVGNIGAVSGNNFPRGDSTSGDRTFGGYTGSAYATGGGGSHNNLQPYIVKYVWQRVS